ncbi:hypothetical protein ACX27_26840 [Nostoc piscinale CENA21]|uniref:Uncharacterized protein n=2 Tax=Nostoc TaxID=1177 RepID=A0A0M4T798_9NOSO|nr:hypothetical protein ACX27_26840 [Nostoc piscinale CENA21]
MLYWVVFAVIIYFCYLNISPYVQVVGILTPNGVPVLGFLQRLPLLGWLFGLFSLGFNVFVGTLLWLVLQSIQIFPIVLRRDRVFMRAVISEADSHSKYAIRDSDDPTLRMLKRWYNTFPTLTVSRARFAALCAYAVDFVICLVAFPPVAGDKFLFTLMAGQLNRINWGNVVSLLLTIYVVELGVRLLFWLSQVRFYLRLTKQEA